MPEEEFCRETDLRDRSMWPVLVVTGFFVDADALVGNVTSAAFDAVVDAIVAGGAECFVVIRGNAQGGAQLLVEFAQSGEIGDAYGELFALVSDQKLLVAGVPEMSELPLQHDAGDDGHLVGTLG